VTHPGEDPQAPRDPAGLKPKRSPFRTRKNQKKRVPSQTCMIKSEAQVQRKRSTGFGLRALTNLAQGGMPKFTSRLGPENGRRKQKEGVPWRSGALESEDKTHRGKYARQNAEFLHYPEGGKSERSRKEREGRKKTPEPMTSFKERGRRLGRSSQR